MAMYAIYIYWVKFAWAKNKNPASIRFGIWEHLQKLALAGLDWIVFCPPFN